MSFRLKLIIQTARLHLHEVRGGGWIVMLRKSQSWAKRILSFSSILAAAPLVLLIVLIRPLVLLRFGALVSQRIGHFVIDVEAYLCARDRARAGRRIVDIIGCPEPVCNIQIKSMWERSLRITPGGILWERLAAACRFWTRGENHRVQLYGRRTDYKLFSNTKAHLTFTDDETQRGRELLHQLGIPWGASWVCIHNRDNAYLDKSLGVNRLYHGRSDYDDYRNFSVKSMVEAADELVRRGYYVLRMGSVVAEELTSTNPGVIDYASCALRSDFADIYLGAGCSAYIGSDSGIQCVPLVFRKPVCYVNFSQTLIGYLLEMDIDNICSVFITKRLWHKEQQRFLSLREMFEAGLDGAAETRYFEDAGVEPVCNTSEEICDLAIEVDERLKGGWQPQLEDEDLQRRFWEIYWRCASNARARDIHVHIGSAFLRKHVDLLH